MPQRAANQGYVAGGLITANGRNQDGSVASLGTFWASASRKTHLTLGTLPTRIGCLVRSRYTRWGLGSEPIPRGVDCQASRASEGVGIGQDGQCDRSEAWREQGLMHDRLSDAIRRGGYGNRHCDNAVVVVVVVASGPMIDPLAEYRPGTHAGGRLVASFRVQVAASRVHGFQPCRRMLAAGRASRHSQDRKPA